MCCKLISWQNILNKVPHAVLMCVCDSIGLWMGDVGHPENIVLYIYIYIYIYIYTHIYTYTYIYACVCVCVARVHALYGVIPYCSFLFTNVTNIIFSDMSFNKVPVLSRLYIAHTVSRDSCRPIPSSTFMQICLICLKFTRRVSLTHEAIQVSKQCILILAVIISSRFVFPNTNILYLICREA